MYTVSFNGNITDNFTCPKGKGVTNDNHRNKKQKEKKHDKQLLSIYNKKERKKTSMKIVTVTQFVFGFQARSFVILRVCSN